MFTWCTPAGKRNPPGLLAPAALAARGTPPCRSPITFSHRNGVFFNI